MVAETRNARSSKLRPPMNLEPIIPLNDFHTHRTQIVGNGRDTVCLFDS